MRYDLDVRTLALAIGLVALLRAGEIQAKKPRPPDLFEPAYEPPDPCLKGKTWKVVTKCLAKQGEVTVVYEAAPVKVVGVTSRAAEPVTNFVMYVERERVWERSNLYAVGNKFTELVGITAFETPLGAGVRVDVGSTTRTSVSVDRTSNSRAMFRRINTTVCTPGSWTCRLVMTSCDVYVRGHLLWTFHGEPFWHPSLGLRVRGDASQAAGMCMPTRTMLDEDDGP